MEKCRSILALLNVTRPRGHRQQVLVVSTDEFVDSWFKNNILMLFYTRQIWHSYCRYEEYASPEVWNLESNITGFKSHICSWRLPVMMSYGCYHAYWREVGRGGNDLINGIKLSARSGAMGFLCAAWIQCCWLVKRSVWWGPRGWSRCENRYGIYLSSVWQQMRLGSNETSCKTDINMRYNFCSMRLCVSARHLNHTFNPPAQPGIFFLVVYALAFLDFKIWL